MKRSHRRGAATVELAMVAPALFLLLFGIFGLARIVMLQQALTNAAREGCRTACLATTLNAAEAELATRNYLLGVVPNASANTDIQFTLSPASLTGIAPGTPITATVSTRYADVSWLPLSWRSSSDPLLLSGQVTQRRE